MFIELMHRRQVAEKVKLFFFEHARNRHKMTTLTPSYHAVSSATCLRSRLAVALKRLARNRTAPTTIVSFHVSNQMQDDSHRHDLGFDLRPFLYPARFPWQFAKIDAEAARLPDQSNQEPLPQAEQHDID